MKNVLAASYLILVFQFIKVIVNDFFERNVPYMAAAISYYAFFAVFPLSLGLITIFSFVLGIEGVEERIIDGLRHQIPVLNEADDEFLGAFFQSITRGRVVGGLIATIGLFWVSQQVFSTIRKSINIAWGIKSSRPFFTERGMDFVLMFGGSLLLFASVFTSAILSFFQELSSIWLPEAPIADPKLWQQIAGIFPPLLSYMVFLILYWWLPNIKLRLSDVWTTALLGAFGFEVSKIVFIYYVRNVSAMTSSIYGGVSMIIILMIFIYVSSIIMLICAILTSKYAFWLAERKQKKSNKTLSENLLRVRNNPHGFGISF
ncbi:MAG: YihY/virulence factor BrkB family protein [SAR202 cluster bacterium]|jgi:membrane protein|nr:YihY/virulence factor BrkB family protein [Dehalococcoidia bacterium]MQG47439.1 YihY/virulence factor BrkB family protein [SAR202 cluster bacterium]|tara:strand:- start:106 stop:1056 length:951 start_codon:yes stop_codon:yes gene_type:complete